MSDNYVPLKSFKDAKKSFMFVPNTISTFEILKYALIDGIATFWWLLAVTLTNNPNKFIPAYYIIIMVFGNLSGAHFNPCITFSLWIYNGKLFHKHHLLKLISYILSQLLLGTLGAYFVYYLDKDKYDLDTIDMKYILRPILIETFFTGTLIFVILMINSTKTRPTDLNYVNVFILTVWLFYIIEAGGKFRGGYNPSAYFSIMFVYTIGKGKSYLEDAWIRMIFPFVGSLIATMLFKYLYRPFYVRRDQKVIHEGED
jgi:glycerol uptake facilitator-like aquaporin